MEYRSPIQPRAASRDTYRRSSGSYSPVPSSPVGRVLKIVTEMGSSVAIGASPAMTKDAAESFVKATEKEKKEMQSLNDRLGVYIEQVRSLEQKHRKLVAELEDLRGKWGQATRDTKAQFAAQLETARKAIDEAGKKKSDIEVQIERLHQGVWELKIRCDEVAGFLRFDQEKAELYMARLGDYSAEIKMAHSRLNSLLEETRREERDSRKLWDELRKAQMDLDEETISRIDYQNQAQTLLEELEFIKNIHDTEVNELRGLQLKEPLDSKQFFKNELVMAVRDIQQEYEYLAQAGKADLESWYKLQVSEVQASTGRQSKEAGLIREEVKRMRDNIRDTREKLGHLETKNVLLERHVRDLTYQLTEDSRQYDKNLNERDITLGKMGADAESLALEIQALLDSKHILNTEILIYRKMLDSEEHRKETGEDGAEVDTYTA